MGQAWRDTEEHGQLSRNKSSDPKVRNAGSLSPLVSWLPATKRDGMPSRVRLPP
jgi:hypothetical protein